MLLCAIGRPPSTITFVIGTPECPPINPAFFSIYSPITQRVCSQPVKDMTVRTAADLKPFISPGRRRAKPGPAGRCYLCRLYPARYDLRYPYVRAYGHLPRAESCAACLHLARSRRPPREKHALSPSYGPFANEELAAGLESWYVCIILESSPDLISHGPSHLYYIRHGSHKVLGLKRNIRLSSPNSERP